MLSKILILFFVIVFCGLEKGGQIFADENKSDENASSLNLNNTSDKKLQKRIKFLFEIRLELPYWTSCVED